MQEPTKDFRAQLSRRYEFLDLAKSSDSGAWYFQDFERQLKISLAMEVRVQLPILDPKR